MARVAVLAIALLLALFQTGEATRCYVCSSSNQPDCTDPFNQRNEIVTDDCQSPRAHNVNLMLSQALRYQYPHQQINIPNNGQSPKVCHKIVLQTGEVIRTCLDAMNAYNAYGNEKNDTCVNWIRSGIRFKYCSSCEGDGCNGAATQSLSIFAGTVALLVSFLLLKQ